MTSKNETIAAREGSKVESASAHLHLNLIILLVMYCTVPPCNHNNTPQHIDRALPSHEAHFAVDARVANPAETGARVVLHHRPAAIVVVVCAFLFHSTGTTIMA